MNCEFKTKLLNYFDVPTQQRQLRLRNEKLLKAKKGFSTCSVHVKAA